MEVVLSLFLFTMTAAVLLGALNRSIVASTRVADRAQAMNLAETVMSRMRLGLMERGDAGPSPFEPEMGPEGWTWQVTTLVGETSSLEAPVPTVRVTIAKSDGSISYHLSGAMP